MIKAAGFAEGRIVETPAYSSSPITKGALFAAVKPGEGENPPELTEEEKEIAAGGGCALEDPNNQRTSKRVRKWMLGLVMPVFVAVYAAILFRVSGNVEWINAWIYLVCMSIVLLSAGDVFSGWFLDIILKVKDRVKKGKPVPELPRTKSFTPFDLAVQITVLFTAAIEMRYSWPPAIPLWASAMAFPFFLGGLLLSLKSFRTNPAITGVLIQMGQKAPMDMGLHSYVRHPGNTLMACSTLAEPVALGSIWAFAPAFLMFVLHIASAYRADKAFHEELEGYREYARKVRYRMIPGVW